MTQLLPHPVGFDDDVLLVRAVVVPTRLSLFKDPEFVKTYPHAQVMLDIVEGAVPRPRHPPIARSRR
jgi:hypothetical protein